MGSAGLSISAFARVYLHNHSRTHTHTHTQHVRTHIHANFYVYLLVVCWSQGNDKEVAYLGIITIAASFVAMIAVGRVLDWTNAY